MLGKTLKKLDSDGTTKLLSDHTGDNSSVLIISVHLSETFPIRKKSIEIINLNSYSCKGSWG